MEIGRAPAAEAERVESVPFDGWAPEVLDVPSYLARLCLEGMPEPSAAGLRTLHRAHVGAIPYENLAIIAGRGVDLALPALQAKLVARRRGGYCFEHNLLFAAALERAGFAVTRLAGRVRLGAAFVRPRTHIVLLVSAGGRRWLADVGFGGEGPLEPIPLEHGRATRQDGWTYRLVCETSGWAWALQLLRHEGWVDLYGFTLDQQHPIDYVVANHFTSTHPISAFTRVVTAQRTGPHVRWTMRGRRLTESEPDGTTRDQELEAGDLDGVLRGRFGIELDADELDAVCRRWPDQP